MIFPASLLSDLKGFPGFNPDALQTAHEQPAPVSIRLHPVKGAHIPPSGTLVPWCQEGYYLPERPVFTLDPAFHAGAYYVQEASSMFLNHVLQHIGANNSDLRVLDLCAAPGGKSTLTASLLHSDSLLVSNEVIRSRATILEENMSKWGYPNTMVVSNDPRDLGKLHGFFDVIIVDAPCSGSGLWRKDPRAISEWSPENVTMCAGRQTRILDDIWPALKENGILIYATCSFSPEEDEWQLDTFADNHSVSGIAIPIEDSWGVAESITSRHTLPSYRFFPGNVVGEGFFIAAFRKTEPASDTKPPRSKLSSDKKIAVAAQNLLVHGDYTYIPGHDGNYIALPTQFQSDYQTIKQFAYIRRAGVEMGAPSAKEWIPTHDLALSLIRGTTHSIIELNREQALHYLKREDMSIEIPPKGWHLVSYQGNALGWIKSLGNRINNYLPKQWRIRMDID